MKFYGFATQTGARQPVIEAFREAGWRALARASPRTAYQIVGWRAPVVLAKPQNFIKNNIFKIAQIARQPPQTDVLSVGWRALARASPHGHWWHRVQPFVGHTHRTLASGSIQERDKAEKEKTHRGLTCSCSCRPILVASYLFRRLVRASP